MNKILNWTLGGFFRALGRVLAFVVIGVLVAFVAQKNNLKITDLLGIGTVYADTFSTKEARWFYDVQGTESATSWQTIPYTQNFNWPVTQGQYRLKISNGWSSGSSYKFKISYLPGTPAVTPVDIWFSDIDNNRAEKTCTGWVTESNNYKATTCVIEPAFDISSSNYMYVRIVFAGNGGYVGSMRSYVGDYQMSLGTAGAINNQTIIINNELQEQTEAINDINDTLEDDNVDEAIDTADDFFSSFTTNTHGLTGIITAPLSAIESLTSATCSPLRLPIPFLQNKYLELPCMRQIYVDNFGGFMTIYDAVTLGIVSYWILVRIFSLVKDFKNPEHDEIEVVDL